MSNYTDQQIILIKQLKEQGLVWEEIAESYKSHYPDEAKSANAIRKAFKRFEIYEIEDDTLVSSLIKNRKVEKTNLKLRKEQKQLIDSHITFDEVLEKIQDLVKKIPAEVSKSSKQKTRIKKDSKKESMVIESILSDLHFGLKTKTFNVAVARERIRKLSNTLIDEKERYSKNYNIEKFNILLGGDIIQSATMHEDSKNSCEITNAEQISIAIESLFIDFFLPLIKEGIEIDVVGVCGNHDRESTNRFTVNPGNTYFTYTIYKTLELLCKPYKNINFNIPTDPYTIYKIFNSYFLLEHGDLVGKNTVTALENQLIKRSAQVSKILSGIRIGHYHEDMTTNLGRHIVNGSLVSDDHFGNGLGYKSRPAQVINYYVETNKRENCYYHSFIVNLNEI